MLRAGGACSPSVDIFASRWPPKVGEGGGGATSWSFPAERGGVVPSDDPPLDLSLFIGARIAISGDTEEFEEVRTAVHL